ncbi:MAG: septum site-determining protein MinC [Hyphomicrobiales bacterium]
MTIATRPRSSLRFRGRSFLAIVLTPEMPVEGWLAEVDAWLARTPGFLAGKPLVVDVTGLALQKSDFRTLLSELRARSVSLLGVEGVEPSWLGDGDPPLLTGGRTAGMVELPDSAPPAPTASASKSAYPTAVSPRNGAAPQPAAEPVAAAPKASSTLLIETSVRSGQAIVHPDGDVTVVGSVASGAEIVAGGSIHIYGTLRGRALAGMYGNGKARIFCRRLEAELVAIDGFYKVADELEPQLHKKAVQAWLEGGTVKIMTLD